MEDWKICAIDRLKQYEARRQALETIPMQIAEIESTMTSIRSGTTVAPVSGGKSAGKENMLLSCIVQKEELQRNLERAQLWVDFMNKGLSILDSAERKMLERFYIVGGRRAAEDLVAEYNVDVKTIYRWKDQALRKFTIALYGCTES